MTAPPAQLPSLSQMLPAELDCARKLLDTLAAEHAALIRGDADSINAASTLKLQQMKAFQSLLSERDQFLVRLGFPPGKEGTEALLESGPEDHPTRENWEELQKMALRLRDGNDLNGGIVALEQHHVQQALDILTGRAVGDQPYGPAGSRSNGHQSNSLAKA